MIKLRSRERLLRYAGEELKKANSSCAVLEKRGKERLEGS